MSEFMGLIYGVYEAKPGEGFAPGGASLHSMMTPHGPDSQAFDQASTAELKPMKLGGTQAFMFETSFSMTVTEWGERTCGKLDADYYKCWQTLRKTFDPKWKPREDEGWVTLAREKEFG